MPTTYTAVASNAPNQPRVEVAGTVTRTQTYIASATLSSGVVIWFTSMPIPHGANIMNVKLGCCTDSTTTPSVSIVLALGLAYSGSVNYGKYWGSATFSQSAWKTVNYTDACVLSGVATAPWPVNVSVSDDYQPRYVYPQITVDSFVPASLTPSVTVRFSLAITYTMEP